MESEFDKRKYKLKEAFIKVNSSGADIIQSEYRIKYLLSDTVKMYALIDLIETDEDLDEFKRLTREYLDRVVELAQKHPKN